MAIPSPYIPDLSPQNWIDLDQLGSQPLTTWLQYPGIDVGHFLFPNFRGCGALGEVQDYANVRVEVDALGPDGFRLDISNEQVRKLDQGWVFYSFHKADPNNDTLPGEESLRLFFQVGKRDLPGAGLGVVQFRESHEGKIVVEWVIVDATAVVPPYQAMSEGDKVTLVLDMFYEENDHYELRKLPVTVTAEQVGHALYWSVDRGDLRFIRGGYVNASYFIEYATPEESGAAAEPTESPVQRLDVVGSLDAELLPAPTIRDATGDTLDPNAFPDGVEVLIPLWDEAQAGDVLLLYVEVQNRDLLVEALPLDLTNVDSGMLWIGLTGDWLAASNGLRVTLFWQYARPGATASGGTLQVLVRRPLKMPTPSVEEAVGEDQEGDESRGYVQADDHITRDIYVRIPAEADYGAEDRPHLHWEGHGSTGSTIITDPTVADPRRFQVPSRFVPANMDKRVKIFYRINLEPTPADSGTFGLLIKPMATGWPAIQLIDPPQAYPLSLTRVPDSGARFRLDSWPFMAEKQLVRIVAEGLDSSGAVLSKTLRDDVAVSEEENAAGKLEAILDKAHLQKLKLDSPFSVQVHVSFDDKTSWMPFRVVTLQLVA